MSNLKVATVNGEWMNDWFTPDAEPAAFTRTFSHDGSEDGEQGVTAEAAGRLAGLISAVDADVVALVEAPSRTAELRLFIDEYLTAGGRAVYDFVEGDSGGSQKLALLFKPDRVTVSLTPSSEASLLIDPWPADVDGDGRNRRRIANEAMRIRKAMEQRMTADPASALVVLGDLNDGPGQDYFEELYLAHNVTDILAGSPYQPERLFGHAQARRRGGPALQRRVRRLRHQGAEPAGPAGPHPALARHDGRRLTPGQGARFRAGRARRLGRPGQRRRLRTRPARDRPPPGQRAARPRLTASPRRRPPAVPREGC
ncbi:hypothetical protein GCM10022224_051490 [Nonomuraea antimicrobica]|uniref:Endonuclease/exonuclease/phosphatase domain-containing protein n=1 Tax=Nonomuraea antimicrobica TaxID=561173 RepID=A0ABP7C9F1_9ACTN